MSDRPARKASSPIRNRPPHSAPATEPTTTAPTDSSTAARPLSLLSQHLGRSAHSSRVADSSRRDSVDGLTPLAAAPKVAIPRLKRESDVTPGGSSKSGGRHRINHACEPCRQRKTKCSGERPVCKHCQDFRISCYYADGKRDRVKKQFGSLSEKVQEYEALLRDLSSRVGDEDAENIKRALEKDVTQEDEESPYIADSAAISTSVDAEAEESGDESNVSATVGSTGAVDRIEEDFNRTERSRASGFVGKNSEITWMQRLRQEHLLGDPDTEGGDKDFREKSGGAAPLFASRYSPGPTLPDVDPGFSVGEVTYHLDDFSISMPGTVDPYELPHSELAENLFNIYMTSVHPSFPILGKTTFSSQFGKVFNAPGGPRSVNPGPKWLAIVNLIFAIAAKYSHLIQAEWRGDERDHLLYFTRARIFSMNEETLFNHPDLQQVQVSGLTAFYLVGISQINRAWLIAGMAIRAAVGLGINMRNDSRQTPDASKEMRYRVWWALYTLEHALSVMTGRPTSVVDHVCTTPLPVPFEEELFQNPNVAQILGSEMQKGSRLPNSSSSTPSLNTSTPSSDHSRSASKAPSRSPSVPHPQMDWAKGAAPSNSLYFLHYIQLARINQAVLSRLYVPSALGETWSSVQLAISELNEKLQGWHSNLPSNFDFARKQRDQHFLRHRLILGFACYSTRLTINRPCLCRLDRKIPNQSGASKSFNRNAAVTCVTAAKDMLDMIPDEPNPIGLYQVSPWWSVLHYLMQATIILMLELSFRAHHMPEEAESILEASKKGVRWLHSMAAENLAAERAWSFCHTLIRDAANKVGRDASDLPFVSPLHAQDPSLSAIEKPQQLSAQWNPVDVSTMQSFAGEHGDFQTQPTDFLNASMFTSYDEYIPQAATTSEIMHSLFPTVSEMDLINQDGHPFLSPPGESRQG